METDRCASYAMSTHAHPRPPAHLEQSGRATHLFEGELDGLVLAQLQDVHELHDGFVAAVQLLLALDQLLLLLREVDKLVQSLLVDVTVLLQLRVALLQLPEQLLEERENVEMKSSSTSGGIGRQLGHIVLKRSFSVKWLLKYKNKKFMCPYL